MRPIKLYPSLDISVAGRKNLAQKRVDRVYLMSHLETLWQDPMPRITDPGCRVILLQVVGVAVIVVVQLLVPVVLVLRLVVHFFVVLVLMFVLKSVHRDLHQGFSSQQSQMGLDEH